MRVSFLLFASIFLCTVSRAEDVTFTIDAVHDQHPIPAAVYGVNDLGVAGATVHRHGGNRHTGLNWENNASNAGTDYINSSDSYLGSNAGIGNSQTPGALLQAWVDSDHAQGLKTIITLPIAGYVAADMNGTVSAGETAPSARWKQIVFNKPGPLSLVPDTTDGVVSLGGIASDNAIGAVHAARVTDGRLTVIAINRSRIASHSARFQLSLVSGQSITDLKGYRVSPGGGAQVQMLATPPVFTASSFSDVLPAMSATLYQVQTTPGGFPWWQQSEFGQDASNPTIAGADVDPDHDGLPNLLEYVTNRDPKQPDGYAPLLTQILPASGGNAAFLQLQFQRRKGFLDGQLTLQSNAVLGTAGWSDQDPATLNPTITDIDPQTERWTITLPLPTGPMFYRLKAHR